MKAIWILVGVLGYFVLMLGITVFTTGCVGDAFTAAPSIVSSAGDTGVGEAGSPMATEDAMAARPLADTDIPTGRDSGISTEVMEAAAVAIDSGCSIVHSTGVGSSYTDCVPLNTYGIEEADKACAADVTAQGPIADNETLKCEAGLKVTATGETMECDPRMDGTTFVSCTCWTYSGEATGHVATGLDPMLGNCKIPTTSDPTWN